MMTKKEQALLDEAVMRYPTGTKLIDRKGRIIDYAIDWEFINKNFNISSLTIPSVLFSHISKSTQFHILPNKDINLYVTIYDSDLPNYQRWLECEPSLDQQLEQLRHIFYE